MENGFVHIREIASYLGAILASIVGGVVVWFHKRLDSKLERSVFEQWAKQYDKRLQEWRDDYHADQVANAHAHSRIEGKLDEVRASITSLWRDLATLNVKNNPCKPDK